MVVIVFLASAVFYFVVVRKATGTIPIRQLVPSAIPQSSTILPSQTLHSHYFFNTTICQIEANPLTAVVEGVNCTGTKTSSTAETTYATVSGMGYDTRGEIVDGNLYITKSSIISSTTPNSVYPTRQDELWLYQGSNAIRKIYELPQGASSTIDTVAVSPDQNWIALAVSQLSGSLATWSGNSLQAGSELEVVSSDGSVVKTFSSAQLNLTPTCNCSASILGWGHDIMWMVETHNLGADNPVDFVKIDTDDWSVTNYTSTIPDTETVQLWDVLNFDTGNLLMSDIDLDAGPLLPYALAHEESTTLFSVLVYDVESGETSTLETFSGAEVATISNLSLKWINDDTVQYYDFASGKIATATTP